MRKSFVAWHVLALLVAYLAARLELVSHLESPVFGWRPTDMGAIALNYYRNGFRFFYPQVLWGADGPGYVEMELPLVPFLTALLFKTFGVHESLNLVIPLLSGFGLVLVTYRFGCRLFDPWVGLAAGMVVAVTPVLIMLTDTGLWADPPMVLCATLGLYFVVVWESEQQVGALIAGMACVSLAVLLKLTALYVGMPIAYLFWRRYGVDIWRSPVVWAAGVLTLTPCALWYWHAHELYVEYHNTFGILGAGFSKFGNAALLGSSDFYIRTAQRIALYHLTPLAALGSIYGFVVLVRRRVTIVLTWLLSVAVYVLVAAGGVRAGHYHYLLPFLPVGALTAGLGMVELMRQLGPRLRQRGNYLWVMAASAFGLLFFVNAAAAEQRFETRDRAIDSKTWLQKKQTGMRLRPLTKPGALLIVVDTQMDMVSPEQSMTPPDVFYFSDRRGWYLSLAWLSTARIEALHAKGATDFVVSGQSVSDFKSTRGDVLAYLSGRYQKLMDDDDGIVFALNQSN
jgi:4-amino-4-deoxy-L-arabinose transferase-like glycosyltransferase